MASTDLIAKCLLQDFNLIVILLFSFVPVLIWFKFLINEDTHKEPLSAIFLAFILGILAAYLSYHSESALAKIYSTDSTGYYFFSALIEEFFKFILVFIFIMPTKNFHYLIDAMIYLGISGLGFAFIENFGLFTTSCVNFYLENDSFLSMYGLIILTSFLRFLGANFLHLLASVLIGFGYSITLKTRRVFPLLFSFLMASLLHFIFNMFIINSINQEDLKIFSTYIFYIIPLLWSVFFIVLNEFKILKKLDGRIRTSSSN